MISPQAKKFLTQQLKANFDPTESFQSANSQIEDFVGDIADHLKKQVGKREFRRHTPQPRENDLLKLNAEWQRNCLIPYARLSKLIARIRWHTWGDTQPLERFSERSIFDLEKEYLQSDANLRAKLKILEEKPFWTASKLGFNPFEHPLQYDVSFRLHSVKEVLDVIQKTETLEGKMAVIGWLGSQFTQDSISDFKMQAPELVIDFLLEPYRIELRSIFSALSNFKSLTEMLGNWVGWSDNNLRFCVLTGLPAATTWYQTDSPRRGARLSKRIANIARLVIEYWIVNEPHPDADVFQATEEAKMPKPNDLKKFAIEHGAAILGSSEAIETLNLDSSRDTTDALKQVRVLLTETLLFEGEEKPRGLWRFANFTGDLEIVPRPSDSVTNP